MCVNKFENMIGVVAEEEEEEGYHCCDHAMPVFSFKTTAIISRKLSRTSIGSLRVPSCCLSSLSWYFHHRLLVVPNFCSLWRRLFPTPCYHCIRLHLLAKVPSIRREGKWVVSTVLFLLRSLCFVLERLLLQPHASSRQLQSPHHPLQMLLR